MHGFLWRERGRPVSFALEVKGVFEMTLKQASQYAVALLIILLANGVGALGEEYNLGYDGNGNLEQGKEHYFEYNSFNQLVRVREDNSTGPILEEYAYDHEGNRVFKKEFNSTGDAWQTTYYVDKNFIRVVNDSGSFDTVYYYHGDTLVGRKDWDEQKYFYHPDHLGSTDIVTDESGALVEKTDYLPFGEVLTGGNDRFLFTGKEKDQATGLQYHGARYYDPEMMKFTQPDSMIPDVYDPQLLNRYAYVKNNPLKYVDPNGEAPEAKNEIGTLGQFQNFANERYSQGSMTNTQMIDDLANFYDAYSAADAKAGIPRYINTKGGGLIDLKHYFSSAKITSQSDTYTSLIGGYLVEQRQYSAGDPSGYSFEDLSSNMYGRQVVGGSRFLPNPVGASRVYSFVQSGGRISTFKSKENLLLNIRKDMLEKILKQIGGLGATDPSEYEDYESLPDENDGNPPSNTNKQFTS